MHTPSEFDDIRPFEPDELPAVYERLLVNPQFQAVVHFLYPKIPMEVVARRMRRCKTNMEFQLAFGYPFLKNLIRRASKGCDMDTSEIDNTNCYTFMSNHRDIVLDSAFLDMLLIDKEFLTTCEIAIGDNLLSLPWVLDIVRVNKSFIVKRGLMARERLESSIKLSRYMHYAINEKNENLWIAQREGRSKDSDDRTQKAILKMLSLGSEGTPLENLMKLRIVPLSISYEFDPCDFLKAAEFQAKRDDPNWTKGPMDDIISMQTGIIGYKGHIHYHAAACINDYLEQLKDKEIPTGQMLEQICEHIDRQIHRNYRLYPNNFIAWDELTNSQTHADKYTAEEKREFDTYLQSRVAKVNIPNKDEAFLRERILTMYANPAINHAKAHQKE
ncbi:MAG: acyltransferase [Prevotella sp.]|nr:acyltransferase [Prevotella sp.]